MNGIDYSKYTRTYTPRYKYLLTCHVCKNDFGSNRIDAKCCTARCRKRLQRASEREIYEDKHRWDNVDL